MFESFAVSQILLLAITLHASLIGSAASTGLWRALPEGADNFPMRAFFALALGLALQMALLFVAGAVGAFAAPVLIGVSAAAGALALAGLARAGAWKASWRVAPAEIVVAVALYALVASTAARAPGNFDDTMYHLPLARFYAQTGSLGLDPWLRFPLFPQNMELLFALAFALRPGDVVLAQGLASLPAFVVALGLVGAARWLRGSWVLGVGAGVAFLACPSSTIRWATPTSTSDWRCSVSPRCSAPCCSAAGRQRAFMLRSAYSAAPRRGARFTGSSWRRWPSRRSRRSAPNRPRSPPSRRDGARRLRVVFQKLSHFRRSDQPGGGRVVRLFPMGRQ